MPKKVWRFSHIFVAFSEYMNFNGVFTFVFQRESDVEKLQQGQIRAEKRVKALKERMKKMTPGQAPGLGGPDPDEIFEDEEEGNE